MPSAARPGFVFVTHHLPWPACSGGRVREAQLLQRLSARFDIEVVAVSKVPEFDRSHIAEATRHGVRARVFAAVDCGGTRFGPLTRRHAAPAPVARRGYLSHNPAALPGCHPRHCRVQPTWVARSGWPLRAPSDGHRLGARRDPLARCRSSCGLPPHGGGGVKVKVLEALARGCAVVATPIALQGLLHLPPGAAVECADGPAIAAACVRLLASPRQRERQRARAAQAAQHLPSWDFAADTLADAWSEMAAIAASGSIRA